MHNTSPNRVWVTALTSLVLIACGDDTSSNEPTSSQNTTVGTTNGTTGNTGGASGTATTSTATSSSSQSGTGGAPPMAPPFRNPVALPDDELAPLAIDLLGANDEPEQSTKCARCHTISSNTIHEWAELSATSMTDCLTDTTVPTKEAAEDILACFRKKSGVPTSPYWVQKLGIYATAANLDWFKYVFDTVYGDVEGPIEQQKFRARAGMPRGTATAFSQGDFDIVAEWFARGTPLVDDLLPEDLPPGNCMPHIDAKVATHVDELALKGWRAKNEVDGLLMFGCAGASDALGCLTAFPSAADSPATDTWAYLSGTTARILNVYGHESSFWTRSSADGRYVGHGGGTFANSTIVDLLTNQLIGVDAAYDPGFFPDNTGFIFQGGGTGICRQSLLSTTTHVTFNEPECSSSVDVGLYQHVGAALDGGDYWSVDGGFTSDDGGDQVTLEDPFAGWGSNSSVTLTPMVYDGSSYVPKQAAFVDTPFEGDTVLSPSSRLMISRRSGSGATQRGFVLREVIATPQGQGYDVTAPEIARYCFNGGKPGFSYDERWVAIHHYIGDADAVSLGFTSAADPGFAPYRSQGASNIYLLDLLTGNVVRVTHMKPGQYALYPHFRSDGWIYYIVRSPGTGSETIVASDAALVQENL